MPLDDSVLQSLATASRLSTAQLDRIAHSVLGGALATISNASTPEQQALDMIEYAHQYDLTRELAAAFLYTGADKPALQNLLLGRENMEDTRPQNVNVALDLVKLENRVERMFDKLDAKLDAAILEMRHMRADSATHQPISLSGKMLAFLIFVLAAMFIGQISLLAWVGALVNG